MVFGGVPLRQDIRYTHAHYTRKKKVLFLLTKKNLQTTAILFFTFTIVVPSSSCKEPYR
jgi:hypothetical protein